MSYNSVGDITGLSLFV